MKRFILILGGIISITACRSAPPDSSPDLDSHASTCAEPENPYEEGSGHYAEYEWAENNSGTCDGRSQSFAEGCEEYESQKARYEECEAKKRN